MWLTQRCPDRPLAPKSSFSQQRSWLPPAEILIPNSHADESEVEAVERESR